MAYPDSANIKTIKDLLPHVVASVTNANRGGCVIRDKLIEKQDEWSIDDFEKWLYSQPVIGVENCIIGIREANHALPAAAADLQCYYAKHLVTQDFKEARGRIELMLHQGVRGGIDPEALKTLTDWMRAHHPHAEAFFAQDLAHK